MTERDLCIAEAILQNMSEAQKEHLFEVIKNYNAVRGKFAPIMIAGEEVHMLAAVKN